MVVVNEKDSGMYYIDLLLLFENLNTYLFVRKQKKCSKSNINLKYSIKDSHLIPSIDFIFDRELVLAQTDFIALKDNIRFHS